MPSLEPLVMVEQNLEVDGTANVSIKQLYLIIYVYVANCYGNEARNVIRELTSAGLKYLGWEVFSVVPFFSVTFFTYHK